MSCCSAAPREVREQDPRAALEARKHLRAALAEFERLGAAPWAERARAELQGQQ
jgi:hypothetical protein